MTIIWLLCVILLGPGPSFVASIDGIENAFSPHQSYVSLGEPISQIKYLEAYVHSITSVPQDYENYTSHYDESKSQAEVDKGSHENVVLSHFQGIPDADSSSVDQHNKFHLDILKIIDSRTSQTNQTQNAETSKSIDGLIINPGAESLGLNLALPPNQPIPLPVCNGAECSSEKPEVDDHFEDLDPEEYEDLQFTDDVASVISDVLFLTLEKKSSLTISFKVYRPSPFLKNKAGQDASPETENVDLDSDTDDDEDVDVDIDDPEDSQDDEEVVQERKKSELALLKTGQTGILLDGSQSEGVLLVTQDPTKTDSTNASESLSQSESSAKRKGPGDNMNFIFVGGDEPGRKWFEKAALKPSQTDALFYDSLSGSASLIQNATRASPTEASDFLAEDKAAKSHAQFPNLYDQRGHRGTRQGRRSRGYAYRRHDGRKFISVRRQPQILVTFHNYYPSDARLHLISRLI